MATNYGYARVSTVGQDLTAQEIALKEAGATVIYAEKFTGTTRERPKLKEVLDVLERGDTLTVTKLDRIARTAADAMAIIQELIEKGVRVHILNMGTVEDTTTGRLMLNIFAAFAEFERDLIVERMEEGKALARQREGYVEGRPKKYKREQRQHAMQLLDSGHSYKHVSEITGMSRSTLQRIRRGYKSTGEV